MKKEDKYTMQISTIHKFQKALDGILKVIKFIWRHALTLIVLGMMLSVANGASANWVNILITLSISQLIDFGKMQIKWKIYTSKGYHPSSSITPYTQANYWNSHIVGTPAYLSDLGRRY